MTGHMAESSQSAISLSLVDIDSLPSCLDFAIAKPGLIKSSSIHWHGVPADHAGVVYEYLRPVVSARPAAKRNWTCIDEEGCRQWMQRNCPETIEDADALHSWLRIYHSDT